MASIFSSDFHKKANKSTFQKSIYLTADFWHCQALETQQECSWDWTLVVFPKTLIFVLTQIQWNTQISSSQKLLASCSKNSHPRSSLHVHDERNQSIQPATKEGSPSCLERGHVSQLQRGSAAATSLWNHRSDDGSRRPDSTGNGDSGGWRMSLVKYGPVRGERGWARWCRAVAPRGWLHHWASGGMGGREGGWRSGGFAGTRLRLEAYLPSTRSPHLFQLPRTINTNIPTSISAFQVRKALMRMYCPVVVTVWTPRDAGGIGHLHTP